MIDNDNLNEMKSGLIDVSSIFEAQVKQYGKLPAVSFKGEVWTYEEANSFANQIARDLKSGGLERGEKVAIDANCNQWFIVGILGILKAGGAYVPLDPKLPQARLDFMIKDTHAKILLSETNSSLKYQFAHLNQISLDKGYDQKKTTKNLEIRLSDQDLAYVMYTSGSTGEPKGVEILHGGIIHLVCNAEYVQLGPKQIHLQLAPNGFDAATFEIWAPILNGGLCVVFPKDHFSLHKLETVIQLAKVTTLWLASSLFNIVVKQHPEALRTIKQLLVGGEVLSLAHIRMAKKLLPNTRLINGYGPTEATTFTCCHTITSGDVEDDKAIPIGQTINRAYVRILDEAGGQVTAGEVGELCIGGPGLARGYLNKPELTKEKFIRDTFTDSKESCRLYRTGDLVRMRQDNIIEYIGRIDLQVKIRGHRIEPGEVEAVLKKETPFITSAVVAYQTRTKDYALAAFMEPVENKNVASAIDVLKKVLPSYLIPTNFELISKLPLTASGKIDRVALSKKMEQVHVLDEALPPALLTDAEANVAMIWCNILNLSTVNLADHFFQIGGNSLLAIRMIAAVRSQLQASASVASVFQNPTLGQFTASLVFDEFTPEYPVDAAGDGVEENRITYGQRQIWVEHHNSDAKTAYNIVCTIDIKGELDADILKRSLTIIADRHSMLRTGFVQDCNQILRVLQEPAVLPFFEEECPFSAPQLVTDFIEKKIELETLHVFSLSDSELPYRMTLISVNQLHRILLINFHHILVDEWSLEIFFGELAKIYKALKKTSGQYEHTELTACYDDFCDWQNHFLKSAEYRQQLDYWRDALADLSPELLLPKKTALVAQSKGGLLSEEVFIPAKTIIRLEELASSQGATLFTLLLSVYALTLAKLSGNTDLSIGTPVSLRDQSDFQTIIGYFLNTIVIRAKPKQGEIFLDFLRQMHLTLMDAIRNKDVPLEVLAAELNPIRDDAGRPFFQTLFAIQRGFDKELLIPDTDTSISFYAGNSCKTDLALQFVTEEEGYLGRFEYDSSKFEPKTIFELRSVFERFIQCLNQGETIGIGFLTDNGKIKSILESKENISITETAKIQETGDLKIALVRCWQKCLRLTSFDPDISFFDLGGNSILALQLVAEIEKSIGLPLDLQVIFTHKTFTAILEQCNKSYSSSGDLVVTLRSGLRSSTVYCIHGVTYYKDLAEVFPADHNVVGLMSQSHQEIINNLSIGVQVSVDLPLLIDQYHAKVRHLQPEGPYYLVGHSFGGILAFEVASRLQKEGCVVEQLILVDVLLPGAFHPHWLQKIRKLQVYVRNNMWSEMRAYVLGGVTRKLLLLKDKIFGAKALSSLQHNHVISNKIGSLYEDAMHQYQPSVRDYKGRVVLVRADETRSSHARKDDFGWQNFIEGPIEFVDVPGDHLSCVSQPNLGTLNVFLKNSTTFDQSSQS